MRNCIFASVSSVRLSIVIETATGRTQWEVPGQSMGSPQMGGQPAAPVHHGKRRQYAAGQTQAYYGATDGFADAAYGAPAPGAPQQPSGQLFTPGLAAENQFQAQQGQPPYMQPAQPDYINAPGYGQQPQQQQPGFQQQMGAVTDQFSQMGIQGGMGQKPFALYTTNLLTAPPDPRELQRPPPEIRLPPNASVTPSPNVNADPSYARSTINAIPTTSSLLSKSKIPFALVLSPYRSLKEGDQPVPLITDTVIARCRRCRSYINPFVQFIDGGHR